MSIVIAILLFYIKLTNKGFSCLWESFIKGELTFSNDRTENFDDSRNPLDKSNDEPIRI